ncbi:uncharacterized protein DFL_009849 [Arthrobotrys flagrans]|uniref:Uncharacterized protein n=1 Tax=Arthrobotrys flagrans TaxID=97331 RepID=A0A436ZT41_ARTFL|nr:hypothetical protein DFL_009849 [Arthrobotrys flagrans]
MKPSLIVSACTVISLVSAGPLAYGVCQAGCAAVVTACYGAAGFVWGATLATAAPPAIIACLTMSALGGRRRVR